MNNKYDLKLSKEELNNYLIKFESDNGLAYIFPYNLVDNLKEILFYKGIEPNILIDEKDNVK